MAGEHILKLLIEENARISVGHRRLIGGFPLGGTGGIEYTIFEHKPYAKNTKTLLVTQDEELACKILKGTAWMKS